MRRALPAFGAVLAAVALLAPVRHRVRVERAEGNPIQRIALESRSLLGLPRRAWAASAAGDTPAWGGAREGFFAAPAAPARMRVKAWPGFVRDVDLVPSGDPGEAAAPWTDQGDLDAFRRWFVAILEAQLEGPSPAWEPAQRDCAGLLRFAFREAWGPHTEAWRARTGFPGAPVGGDPSRLLAGPWARAFPTPEGWSPFARGAYLRRLSCVALGRDTAAARPGDLLFFSRADARATPDHAMAFVRPDVDGQPMLLYHTGPEGSAAGEVRRVRLDELLHHPDGAFRPVPGNPAFLGVYRWKILAERS